MERRDVRPELLKGHLDLLLLAALRLRPAHGYAIVAELRRLSRGTFHLPEGTIYPALYRLERGELLASEWSAAGGRRRRVYRLTERGEQVLSAYLAEWDRLSSGVNAVLEEVVDTDLHVRGLSGLRVADGSVLPTIPSGNTNSTIYAIAERAAELIRSQHEMEQPGVGLGRRRPVRQRH